MEMMVNGISYKIEPKTIVFRKPGDVVSSAGSYDCYCITLDFSGDIQRKDYNRRRQGKNQRSIYDKFFAELPIAVNSEHFDECVRLIEQFIPIDTNVPKEHIMEVLFLFMADAYRSLKKNPQRYNSKITRIIKYIDENLHKKITLDELAELSYYTKGHFINVFKKSTGLTPFDYIRNKRLKKSENLLVTTDLSVSEISELCGFTDVSFFIRQFKAIYEITPAKFRATRSVV